MDQQLWFVNILSVRCVVRFAEHDSCGMMNGEGFRVEVFRTRSGRSRELVETRSPKTGVLRCGLGFTMLHVSLG